MPILIVLAAIAVAAAVPLLWWALAGSGAAARSTTGRNLLTDHELSSDLRQAVLALPASQRAVQPLLDGMADRARRLTPMGWVDGLERRLVLAGRPDHWPIERVLAAKLLLGVAGLMVGLLYFTSQQTPTSLLMFGAATALGYFTPDLLLYSRATERQKQIQLELADTLDQMTIAVEAGLGFEAAMVRAGRTGKGPLAQELVRTLQEIQVGVPRSQALRNLSDRTDVSDLRQFIHAVIQAEGYGIPVADVLRTQAGELRVKRRQRAEERAMKIPVKILFPLITCIFPVLFIVILGPAVIQISRTLFGAGGALN